MTKLFFNVFFTPTNIHDLAHNPITTNNKRQPRIYSNFCLFSPLVNYELFYMQNMGEERLIDVMIYLWYTLLDLNL